MPTTKSSTILPIHGFDNIQTANDNNVDMTATSPCWKWYCAPGIDSTKVGAKRDRDDKLGWWKLVFTNEDEKNAKDDSSKLSSSSSLHIAPPAKKDFWRKTYYEPLLVKDDGSFLYTPLSMESDLPATIETSFTITNPKNQFDQAGILIRIDHEHWIKTGIEVVDNIPRLSCVVTNGFSDWSTQSWPSPSSSSPSKDETNKDDKAVVEPKLRLRVHLLPQNGGSFVVEAASHDSNEWSMVRICHMNPQMNSTLLNDHETVRNAYEGNSAPSNSIMVGIFAACPIDQDGSCVTKFHDISITPGSTFIHTAS